MTIDQSLRGGRVAGSNHYTFGSQDASMGSAILSRNPNITPAENLINTLLDLFFVEISSGIKPRGEGSQVTVRMSRAIQQLSNPAFHLWCESTKRTSATPLLQLQGFVETADAALATMKVAKHGEAPPSYRLLSRFYKSDWAPSVEQLAATCQELAMEREDGSRTLLSGFKDAREAAVFAIQRAKPFQGFDFQALMMRLAKHGDSPDASKSDHACERAKTLYRGFVTFTVAYAPLVMREKELTRFLDSHQFPNLEEIGRLAAEAVVARLDVARAAGAAREELEVEKLAALEQAKLEEYRREAAAAQRAEDLRLKLAEEARERGVREFHSRFQEAQLPDSIVSLLEKLESGSGIPTPQRRYGELLVTQVLDPLRHHLIDLRGDAHDRQGDPAVERFAALVFSPSTIALLAKSFGIDSEKCFNVTAHAGRAPLESNVTELCELCQSSPAVRGMVKTMLNQADGIIVLAALALPPSEVARYARARDWNGLGVDRAGRELRQPLAHKLHKVIEDKRIVRAARESLPSLEPVAEKKKSTIEIPTWIDEVINPDEFAYELAEGHLLIASREAPTLAMYIPTKGLSSKETFQKQYKQKLNELLVDVEVERRLERLETYQGFSISRTREEGTRRVTVSHPEYDIAITLEGLSSQWHGALDTIEQRFHQCETSWSILLERAQRFGFDVTRSSDGVCISHPSLGTHSLAAGQFVPVRQLHRVTALVDQAQRLKDSQQRKHEVEKRRVALVERVLQSEVLPSPTDEIIVPDANVFMSLVAPREGGGSWLDLLSATASLKHVRVMVPAIVADFELTGRVIPFDSSVDIWSSSSMLSWTSSAVQSFREFFEGATRIKIEYRPDGTTAVARAVLGSNRNLVIVESPGDDMFYERVRELDRDAQGNTKAFHDLVRSELYHAGEGDAAISRFLKHSPFTNHVTVITSDIRYMKHGMPRITGNGAPVSGCSVGSYVEAECQIRGDSLAEILGSSEPVHFHTIAEDVANNPTQGLGKALPLFSQSVLGTSGVSGLTPKGIVSVLRES